MRRISSSSGFTLIEFLTAAFMMTVLISGAFVVFGVLSEKAQVLFAGAELRNRVRLVEALLRQDIERAVPTAELEFYAERDGVPGPHFIPEPFADYGNDGVPSPGEAGYSTVLGFENLDPNCDNFSAPVPAPPGCVYLGAGTEGNGLLDQGEWLFDIDGNGRYTGERYWDVGGALEQRVDPQPADPGFPPFPPPPPAFPYAVGAAYNFQWDFNPILTPGSLGGFFFPHETWPNVPGTTTALDVDGDGIYSPHDDWMWSPLAFLGDPTPPQDNPLTLAVDETMRASDGAVRFRFAAMEPDWTSANLSLQARALAFDSMTRNYQILSPFGFLDADASGFAAEAVTDWSAVGPLALPVPSPPAGSSPAPGYGWSFTNNRFDPGEVLLYDYFGGMVNNGDQDTLYLRTRVDIGGQLVPANVYYRLVFVNKNNNYAETFLDTGTTDTFGNTIGAGDGIWQPGEPLTGDLNSNGVPDAIVDPGERILQRIVALPGNPNPLINDLGPAIRFNLEYFDEVQRRFVAPFSDTGIDGVYSSQEATNFGLGAFNAACADPAGDDFFPGLNPQGTENNGILDLVNASGIPVGNLNSNPFLSATPPAGPFVNAPFFPSGVPGLSGENPFVGIKKFGYPESAGSLVFLSSGYFYPLDAREPLPVLGTGDWIQAEPVVLRQAAPYQVLYPITIWICDPNAPFGSCDPTGGGASCPLPNVPQIRVRETVLTGNRIYRFAPAAIFDEEGWLRCAGIKDSFAFLRPGDEVFVWGFRIPPESVTESPATAAVTVPVPPNYYPVLDKRGNRLRLDLSKVPGGTPSPEILRGTPAVFRAGYLPPAMRVDFALEGTNARVFERDLRVWSLLGEGWRIAGQWSQGTGPSIPIRGTVFTVAPGQGSGRGSSTVPESLPWSY